jgi:3',5'-cyclic AMP phosphodiesterase CpdA
LRIVHLSDIHVWRYILNPFHLFSKRALGMMELLAGRARRFRLERLAGVVEHVVSLEPDHVLITGDISTTALPKEFRAALQALAPLLADPEKVTVLPGNHDRYSSGAVRSRLFEEWFGAYAPQETYPWLRWLDEETAILGLDPTRHHISAKGYLPPNQLAQARALAADAEHRPPRLIVACHYPLFAPPAYFLELKFKCLANAAEVAEWLSAIGPHLFCCGHVHAAWAFRPFELPDELCLNAGAPLLRDNTGLRLPGFLEVVLDGPLVTVIHHAWMWGTWSAFPLVESLPFFPVATPPASPH